MLYDYIWCDYVHVTILSRACWWLSFTQLSDNEIGIFGMKLNLFQDQTLKGITKHLSIGFSGNIRFANLYHIQVAFGITVSGNSLIVGHIAINSVKNAQCENYWPPSCVWQCVLLAFFKNNGMSVRWKREQQSWTIRSRLFFVYLFTMHLNSIRP